MLTLAQNLKTNKSPSTYCESFWRRVFPVNHLQSCTGTDNLTRTTKRQNTKQHTNNTN